MQRPRIIFNLGALMNNELFFRMNKARRMQFSQEKEREKITIAIRWLRQCGLLDSAYQHGPAPVSCAQGLISPTGLMQKTHNWEFQQVSHQIVSTS
jgi:hypothetical protein